MTLSPAFFTSKVTVAALLIALLAGCGGNNPETMVASARDFLSKSDAKSAIIQLKVALQEKPEMAEARFLLGQALLRTGDSVGSESELRKSLALKHPTEVVVPLLARSLSAQGQFKKLTDEFGSTLLSSAMAQAELKAMLVQAYRVQGKPSEAQAALAAALAADPNNADARLFQARERASNSDFDGAMVIVDDILAKTPTFESAYKFKGDMLAYGKQDLAGAMLAYRKAVEVKPTYTEGHAAILTQLLRDRKLDDAAKQLDSLRKAAPGTPTTVYFETMLAYQKRDLKVARERSQQLIKIASNSPMTLQLAGAVELEANVLIQAESYLAKSLQLTPEVTLTRRLLITTYLRSGQAAKALTTAQPFLKEAEKLDASLCGLMGEVFLQNGDPKRAEEFFARATKLNPKDERNRTALALTQLVGGRPEVGLAELQELSAVETGTTATMALISTHLRRGEFDKALKAIDSLEKKQPGKPLAHNLRGRTLLAKKDVVGARRSFERSLEIDPSYFASVASLAAMDLAEKKTDDARKRFEAVIAKDPKNGPALLALAELRLRAGGTKEQVTEMVNRAISANPTDKSPRLLLINYHIRNKDFKQALSVAQNAVAAIPESPELQDALGSALLATGDTNQAMAAFNKVSSMQPGSPWPFVRIADTHLAAKNKKAAIESLRRALAVKPDTLEVQTRLVALFVDQNSIAEAVRVARDVQKQQPKSPSGYVLEGDIALAQKNWIAAADVYRVGLKAISASILAVKTYSALLEGGKKDEADRFAAGWIKDKPVDHVFRTHIADVATARNELADAEKHYQAVLRMQPNNAVVLNNLAWISGKLNKDGIPMAQKALELAPDQPAFMDTLAGLYSDKGDYAKALEWQNRAVAKSPSQATYKLNLAKIHIKGGKKDLARKELYELTKLGDKFVRQAEVTELLKKL